MINAEKTNQEHWDEKAQVHIKSYDLTKLRNGGHLLDEIQVKELGDITDKKLLHLQCHIGSDTLSLARLGANVTGIDISGESIRIADDLSKELKIDARFIQSNVYDLPEKLDEKFDVVYTSQGVLCWLKDLKTWADIIANYLELGGFFYIMESHPLFHVFQDESEPELKVKNSYFHRSDPTYWKEGDGDYSDENYITKTPSYEWQWSLSDIVNSLVKAGLEIEFLNEFDKIFYWAYSNMVRKDDGWWYLPESEAKIPLTFTLKARKKQ